MALLVKNRLGMQANLSTENRKWLTLLKCGKFRAATRILSKQLAQNMQV